MMRSQQGLFVRSLFLTLLFLLVLMGVRAQQYTLARHEVHGGVAASNFFGELGGNRGTGRIPFPDFDTRATRYALTSGYRYTLNRLINLRSGLTFGLLHGSDAYSGDPYRRSRNLSFRSPLLELSGVVEVYILEGVSKGSLSLKSTQASTQTIRPYLFGGIAGTWFNPQAKYQGKWYNLQELRTEGQGLPNGAAPYKRITIAIPMGIGVRYSLTQKQSIGAEIGFRLTFSDYIDDVGGTYYDPYAIAAANGGLGSDKGQAAFNLSNPAIPVEVEGDQTFTAGGINPWFSKQVRGSGRYNDSYALLSITYALKL
jgi:hypothetical protein